VNSVISVGYYFKILHAMYFRQSATAHPIEINLSTRLTLAVTSFVTLFIGVAPQIGFAMTDKLVATPTAERTTTRASADAMTTPTTPSVPQP
jgi:NADH:ubiquinone oxidoreductase subunit 2 (subunit N)